MTQGSQVRALFHRLYESLDGAGAFRQSEFLAKSSGAQIQQVVEPAWEGER